jgi:hypothetical protein
MQYYPLNSNLNSESRGLYSSCNTVHCLNTEEKETDIYALSGIRTDDPSVRADDVISCLRPRDHCDRLFETNCHIIQKI